jgi:hypothetical protein
VAGRGDALSRRGCGGRSRRASLTVIDVTRDGARSSTRSVDEEPIWRGGSRTGRRGRREHDVTPLLAFRARRFRSQCASSRRAFQRELSDRDRETAIRGAAGSVQRAAPSTPCRRRARSVRGSPSRATSSTATDGPDRVATSFGPTRRPGLDRLLEQSAQRRPRRFAPSAIPCAARTCRICVSRRPRVRPQRHGGAARHAVLAAIERRAAPRAEVLRPRRGHLRVQAARWFGRCTSRHDRFVIAECQRCATAARCHRAEGARALECAAVATSRQRRHDGSRSSSSAELLDLPLERASCATESRDTSRTEEDEHAAT